MEMMDSISEHGEIHISDDVVAWKMWDVVWDNLLSFLDKENNKRLGE